MKNPITRWWRADRAYWKASRELKDFLKWAKSYHDTELPALGYYEKVLPLELAHDKAFAEVCDAAFSLMGWMLGVSTLALAVWAVL